MKCFLLKPFRLLKQAYADCRQRFREYAERCLQSGFIPATYWPVQFIARQLAKLLVFIQLGKLRVVGGENLDVRGRFIFCPNHSAMFDAPVLYAIFKRREGVRYMTAYEEMRGLWGLKAVVMGALGCFPVDRTKGKSVIEPAVEVLVSGQNLTIFPEGRVSETGACQPFKKGAAIIAMAALQKLGGHEKVGIVPMHINYHKRHNPTARTDFFKMGFKWRGGVTVTVGKPIYLNDLTGLSPDEVMAEVHKFVCETQGQQTNQDCTSCS